VRKGGQESYLAVTGGFLEVRSDTVNILADACERADEIDVARAQDARQRASELMKAPPTKVDLVTAEAALRRSMVRLKVAERIRRRRGQGLGSQPE
jgi:F-type H+-transporting ATPase subunit epsilon